MPRRRRRNLYKNSSIKYLKELMMIPDGVTDGISGETPDAILVGISKDIFAGTPDEIIGGNHLKNS